MRFWQVVIVIVRIDRLHFVVLLIRTLLLLVLLLLHQTGCPSPCQPVSPESPPSSTLQLVRDRAECCRPIKQEAQCHPDLLLGLCVGAHRPQERGHHPIDGALARRPVAHALARPKLEWKQAHDESSAIVLHDG